MCAADIIEDSQGQACKTSQEAAGFWFMRSTATECTRRSKIANIEVLWYKNQLSARIRLLTDTVSRQSWSESRVLCQSPRTNGYKRLSYARID
jgi:hypothetical protein